MSEQTTSAPPIVLIHELWMTARSWDRWVAYYRAKGYEVIVPTYPGFEIEVEALRERPEIIAAARANGIREDMIASAQESPVYKFVKEWGLALPLHPEFRTLPMLFYVPPMLPVLASQGAGGYETTNGNGNANHDSGLPSRRLERNDHRTAHRL